MNEEAINIWLNSPMGNAFMVFIVIILAMIIAAIINALFPEKREEVFEE